jgi:dephospho-CoA kinase
VELERIVHPFVVERMVGAIHEPGPDVLVLDAIKLFEAGIADHCDVIWVVDADRETRIKRVMARNQVDRAEAERRLDAQPPQEEKLAKADVVIDNGGTLAATEAQVRAALQALVGV